MQSPQAGTGPWQARGLFSSFSDQVREQERGVGNQCVFDTFVNCSYNKGFLKKQQSKALYIWMRSTQKNLLSGGKIAWVIVHDFSFPSWNVRRVKDDCGHSSVFSMGKWEEGTPRRWRGRLSSKTKKAGSSSPTSPCWFPLSLYLVKVPPTGSLPAPPSLPPTLGVIDTYPLSSLFTRLWYYW